jgi:RHS repeat-associated protein
LHDSSAARTGRLVHENGTVSFKASFTGKQVDSDTGLYYFNARWYDAELGRFVTEGPARDGSNWYEFCGNNPLVRIDPDGSQAVATQYGPIPVPFVPIHPIQLSKPLQPPSPSNGRILGDNWSSDTDQKKENGNTNSDQANAGLEDNAQSVA